MDPHLIAQYVLAIVTIFVIFILFLVISRTMNNVVNLLIKLEYLLQKEVELKKEALEVRRIMEEQTREQERLQQERK